MQFGFDGSIQRGVLENYLSRAVTAGDLVNSETLEDDLRVIEKLGVKFLGRASGVWYMKEDDETHYGKSRALAERVHREDPEIILQACVFEIVVERMEDVTVPRYVFEAFGLPFEKRSFRLKDALFADPPRGFAHEAGGDASKHGGIPDLSRPEAQMWFYYRATRYIDCGYEALHMGQVHLYTANDRGMAKTCGLFGMIRDYAAKHARRHKVLMDAHTHGVNVKGKLLFDYHAMPYSRAPLPDEEGFRLVLVREGFSEGGENPNGFAGETMPYLMELDNWGGKTVFHPEDYDRGRLSRMDWWGYDQIGWFAHQSKAERDRFLQYAYRWTQVNNPCAFLALPMRRMLSDAAVPMRRADNHQADMQRFYQLNDAGESCPMGFGQEDAAKACWDEGNRLRESYANPEHLIRYGARDEYDPETGMKLPEKVVVFGSFQPYVGAVENDSNSELTRMYYTGDNTYALTVVLPYAGHFDCAVSTYGTLSATYGADRYPRSGSGNKVGFNTPSDNCAVRFRYRFIDNAVSLDIVP